MPISNAERAGADFAKMVANDPALAAEIISWSSRTKPKLVEHARQMRDTLAFMREKWAAHTDQPFPDRDDWQKIASRYGMSFDRAMDGKWTPADIWETLLGKLQAERDAQDKELKPAEYASLTGVTKSAVTAMRKKGKRLTIENARQDRAARDGRKNRDPSTADIEARKAVVRRGK